MSQFIHGFGMQKSGNVDSDDHDQRQPAWINGYIIFNFFKSLKILNKSYFPYCTKPLLYFARDFATAFFVFKIFAIQSNSYISVNPAWID